MNQSKSLTKIGPIEFTYQVQEVSIQEVKSVETLQATRTDKNFISETGQGSHRAVIRLLITGIDEINTSLRKLIALFKCCPVVSVYNELLSKSWNPELAVATINDQTIKTKKKKLGSSYVPVCLEDLAVSTVPDLPYSFYVTIAVSRIDISSVYDDNVLLYETGSGPSPFPEDATYLKKWIDMLLKSNKIPQLSLSDFTETTISWNGEYITGEKIPSPSSNLLGLRFGPQSHTKVQSEQCSIKNLFAYNVMLGKGYPFVQHMGSTAMYYSMDILFTNQINDGEFTKFCAFKESSDYIARAKERLSRVAGWEVSSPIVKLLSAVPTDRGRVQVRPRSGMFVPLNVNIDTANLPPLNKAVRIDLAETNFEVFSDSETLLVQGGSDYDGLKKYFDSVVSNDYKFRDTIKTDPVTLAKAITGQNPTYDATKLFDDHSTFWPIVNGYFKFSTNETFGLLNKDTLLATFLDNKFDEQEKLRIALQENLTIAGKAVTGRKLPNVLTRFKLNFDQLQDAAFGSDPEDQAYKKVYDIIYGYVRNDMFIAPIIPADLFDVTPQLTANPILVDRLIQKEYEDTVNQIKYMNDLTRVIAKRIFFGFFGDYTSTSDFVNESGTAIQNLADSKAGFSKKFTDALFNVIIKRSGPPESIPRAFSVDGLMAAFLKLNIKYIGDASSNPDIDKDPNKDVKTSINKFFRRSVYEDLLLPKYIELYDSRWEEFAPTFSDVGIVNSMPGNSNIASNDSQNYVTVEENDTVSPYAWFYTRKYKPELLDQVTDNSAGVSKLGHTLHLSIPFGTEDLDRIEAEFAKQKEIQKNNPNYKSDTLSELIKAAFVRSKLNNETEYYAGMNQLAIAASEKYYKKYLNEDARLSLYVHHNNNVMARKRLSAPGLAKEIYTVANDYKLLRPSDRLPHLDTDAGYRSGDRTNEYEFIRSLDDNTRSIIESDLNQAPDIYESAAKMFPATKVYLLEKRGTDLYGDDSFFSVNPIISIDITMDKDDADLAVIRIADPLFILQRDFFPAGNTVTVQGEAGSSNVRQVLGSLKGNNLGGYLKRYKIIEGRAIQIRMGYESMPFNLKTVFTGKIVEIQPGDILTIVCQGWKAELINRQVNFYNDNVKNWGVRDLAIQALQHANPDGFGDFYPQMTSDFIMRNLQGIDVQEFLSTILQRQEGVDTISGSRTVGDEVTNYVYESLSLQTRSEQNKGIDTRLKNIWWPDLASPNNFLGWRQFSNIMPSQVNDGWIIPLQSAWDALKEGTRHAWNSIVQVVPFDGEATLFFGHPDQPYYFTKGGPNSRQKWRKYLNVKNKVLENSLKLIEGFISSPEYDSGLSSVTDVDFNSFESAVAGTFTKPEVQAQIDAKAPTDLELLTDISLALAKLKALDPFASRATGGLVKLRESFGLSFDYNFTRTSGFVYQLPVFNVSDYKIVEHLISQSQYISNIIDRSNLPAQAFDSIRQKLGHRTIPILLRLFYNIPEERTLIVWPTAESDLPVLIKSSTERSEQELQVIAARLALTLNTGAKFAEGVKALLTEEYSDLRAAAIRVSNPRTRRYEPRYFSIRYGGSTVDNSPGGRPVSTILKDYYLTNISIISESTKKLYLQIENAVKELEQYLSTFPAVSLQNPGSRLPDPNAPANMSLIPSIGVGNLIYDRIKNINNLAENLANSKNTNSASIVDVDTGGDIKNNSVKFKIFVYFFSQYLTNNSEASSIVDKITSSQGGLLPPNMQVFRQHHWIDTDHDIIKNNIVASTKDMWNTVVVEYPAHAEARSKIKDENSLFNQADFYSGIKWVYYPKNEVSGVVGLQFHPGLTLANKKVKIFTELNCQSDELAAKLACTHLADGIRRMYRGTLIVTGRIIKPHDRIILNDEYNDMTGPLEVESVVHHWSVDTGWVSNISPQAVCDANPGAAILQTAALEDAFNKVFKVIDYASEALVYASIIASVATLGAATPAAIGAFSMRAAITTTLKGVLQKGRTKFVSNVVKNSVANAIAGGRAVVAAKGSPKQIIKQLWKNYGGLGKSVLGNWLLLGTAQQISHSAFRIGVTSSFVENAQKVEQLPVILAPLYFNGLPFLAGMETDDPVWGVNFNDMFWSLRDINRAGEQLLQSFGYENYSNLEDELKKQ